MDGYQNDGLGTPQMSTIKLQAAGKLQVKMNDMRTRRFRGSAQIRNTRVLRTAYKQNKQRHWNDDVYSQYVVLNYKNAPTDARKGFVRRLRVAL